MLKSYEVRWWKVLSRSPRGPITPPARASLQAYIHIRICTWQLFGDKLRYIKLTKSARGAAERIYIVGRLTRHTFKLVSQQVIYLRRAICHRAQVYIYTLSVEVHASY